MGRVNKIIISCHVNTVTTVGFLALVLSHVVTGLTVELFHRGQEVAIKANEKNACFVGTIGFLVSMSFKKTYKDGSFFLFFFTEW